LLASCCCSAAVAQKLPEIQKRSVYAPANIQIDGKTTEWHNKFEAYNNATQVFYTIANDDQNLYLVVQAVRPQMIQKTMITGINFTVNSTKDKKDKQQVAITFPTMARPEYQKILRIALSGRDGATYTETEPIRDTALKARHNDTLMQRANVQIPANAKMIAVSGIATIKDSLISVYNEYDIQAKVRFDKSLAVTYEFAIPLKYLGFPAAKPGPFAYHIQLNGVDRRYISQSGMTMRYVNGGIVTSGTPKNQDIVSTTDLWGEYTLAKK
jgi:hypothetical protein